MDPVLVVLEQKELSREHIDQVCELFADVEAQDIFTAFEILCKLQTYFEETQSWSFKLLAQYDFDAPPNEFEFDLAKMINNRSRSLLTKMSQWNVTGLRDKVQRLAQLSDWGMVLTSLVLRIINVYAKVEFHLRLALSRSTLVRIHCELHELMSDQVVDETGSTLVNKYRSFVSQLLREIEEAPTVVEQEKMFKTVNDLHHMFSSFKEGQRPATAPITSSSSATSSPASSVPPSEGSSATTPSAPTPPSSASSSSLAGSTSQALVADGVLSHKVLGAFDQARTEQTLSRLRQPQLPQPQQQQQQQQQQHATQIPQNGSLNVKMVDGRMQVFQNGGFVDMQEWLDSANNVKVESQAPQPQPFGSVPILPQQRALPQHAQAKPNIASSAFLQAMRTGRW